MDDNFENNEESKFYLDNINLTLSENEIIDLNNQLFKLMDLQIKKYTSLDSSSVPVETAEELRDSIYFTVKMYVNKQVKKKESIDVSNLQKTLLEGQKEIVGELRKTKSLYIQLKNNLIPIKNLSLMDTMDAIAGFFINYDYKLMAHNIPCMIDYQLFRDVSSVEGVLFIKEYLKNLTAENSFCTKFPVENIILLLKTYSLNYEEDLINIFDSVFVNAIGLCLINKSPYELNITNDDRKEILTLFKNKEIKEVKEIVCSALEALLSIVDIKDKYRTDYMKHAANELINRIDFFKETSDLDGIFLSFKKENTDYDEIVYNFTDNIDNEELREIIDNCSDLQTIEEKILFINNLKLNINDTIEIIKEAFWDDEFLDYYKSLSQEDIGFLIKYSVDMYGDVSDHDSEIPVWVDKLYESRNQS